MQVKNGTWNPDSKIQLENPTHNPNLKIQLQNLSREIGNLFQKTCIQFKMTLHTDQATVSFYGKLFSYFDWNKRLKTYCMTVFTTLNLYFHCKIAGPMYFCSNPFRKKRMD